MVRNNADQSFLSLTFNELLHPETAASNITRRQNDESPWATVYYEAVSGPLIYENMPVAFNVVAIHDDIENSNPQQRQESEFCSRRTNQQHLPLHFDTNTTPRPLPKPQPWQHSTLIDLILGFALTLTAFTFTIKIELTAILIYTIAAGCHYLAEEVFSSSPAMLGKSICMLLCGILMVIDPILLTVSVIVTELIGVVALLLCTIFGNALSGNSWHMFIRKTCHLTRWGFRSCHKGWKPERIFPFSMEDERSQLAVLSCEDPSEGVEYDEPPHPIYSDGNLRGISCCESSRGRTNSYCSTEESTMISDVTFLENGIEYATITIAPENVSVVNEDITIEDQGEPFFKNTQQVIIV